MPEPWNAVDYHIIDVRYNRPLRNNLRVNTTDGFTYSIADMKPDEIKISDLIDNIWTFNRVSVFEPNGIDRNELQIMATTDGGREVVLDEGSIVRETIDTHTNYELSPYVGTTTASPLADDDFEARGAALPALRRASAGVSRVRRVLRHASGSAPHQGRPSSAPSSMSAVEEGEPPETEAQAPPLADSVDLEWDDLEARFAALQAQHPVLPSGGDQATGPVDLGELEARFYALFPEEQMGDQDQPAMPRAESQPAMPRAESQPDLSPVDPDFNDLEARYNALVGHEIDGGGRRHMKRKSKRRKSKRRKSKKRKSKKRRSKTRRK
jgi:hypothetical protein